MVEVAELSFGGILFAGSFYVRVVLKCAHENLLHTEPFGLEGKRKLENLDGDVPEWIVRLKLVFYNVEARLRTGKVEEILRLGFSERACRQSLKCSSRLLYRLTAYPRMVLRIFPAELAFADQATAHSPNRHMERLRVAFIHHPSPSKSKWTPASPANL